MAYHRQQGVDTAIVRIFNTYGPRMRPQRRPRDPDLPAPGARGQAADRVRRRLADATLLLRRRPDPRPRACSPTVGRAPAGQHRQPDRAHDARAARRPCIKVTGSSSEIVFEALPVDDPQVRRPDITRARQLLGWEPQVDLDEGLRRMLQATRPGAGRVSKRVARLSVLAVAVGGLAVRPRCRRRRADRERRRREHLRVGIYDEAQTALREPGRPTFPTLERRCTCRCCGSTSSGAASAASRARGRRDADRPGRPGVRLVALRPRSCATPPTTASRSSSRSSARPRWANGGKAQNVAPTNADRPRRTSPTRRPSATAARYPPSGATARHAARRCDDWLAWNEPNNPVFLTPQYERVGGQLGDRERGRLREDLQRDLQRRPRGARPAGEQSRAASPRRSGNNDAVEHAPVGRAARIPPRGEEGGPAELRRLGAPPVLRGAERVADATCPTGKAAARRVTARQHQRS